MIYATSPQGETIEYRNANWIDYFNTINTISTSKKGEIVANIPREWVLSFNRPEPSGKNIELTFSAALLIVAGNIRSQSAWRDRELCIKLKKEMTHFDSRAKEWK